MATLPYTLTIRDLSSGQSDEIQESVIEFEVDLTTDLASQIRFIVFDPGFKMHNANYFMSRREVLYGGDLYEMATIEVAKPDAGIETVEVMCRTAAIQRMKRDKGAAQFGNISPTSFANQQAAALGLKFFGSSTPAKGAIVRTLDENTDESTWDVLNRLAGEANVSVFESGGILYFAKEEDIIARQTDFTVNVLADDTDPFYMHDFTLQRSDDEEMGATLDASIARENGVKIKPGMVVQVSGISNFPEKMLVTQVNYFAPLIDEGLGDAIADQVHISARTPEDPDDVKDASSKTSSTKSTYSGSPGLPPEDEEPAESTQPVWDLKRGDRGPKVKTLQQDLAKVGYNPGPIDGIFGPKTEAALKYFQKRNGLSQTGIYDYPTRVALARATPPSSSPDKPTPL